MVLALIIGLRSWRTDIYALTPGTTTDVASIVHVEGLATDAHRDRISLVDVYLESLSELQYLYLKFFGSHREFVGADQLLDPGIPQSQLIAQGYLEMSDSQEAAKVAALRALGWRVPATPTGAVVVGVISSTPAARAGLEVSDEITALDGHPVTSQCSLQSALFPVRAGTKVTLRVRPGRFTKAGVLSYGALTTVTLTTASSPDRGALTGCPHELRAGPSWLGIEGEDGVHYALPGQITLDTANIGGPSAGLAMTLTLIDALSKGSLTGGHAIATTGTISPDGAVGPIGGVAEKAVAVENAGLHYFFVPRANYAAARAAAGPRLHVIAVATLAQVLTDLRTIGGAAPVPLTSPH